MNREKKVSKTTDKARRLRPLRIVLAVLLVVLFVLILDRLPTSRKVTSTSANSENRSADETSEKIDEKSGEKTYYYLTGFLNILEENLESRLRSLGVPEEDFENVGEYLSKDEVFEYETKTTLALELESTWVETAPADLSSLESLFGLSADFSFDDFTSATSAPSEYKILSDLLEEYEKTLTTVEDYDIIES